MKYLKLFESTDIFEQIKVLIQKFVHTPFINQS
jgi:hypothetical protein